MEPLSDQPDLDFDLASIGARIGARVIDTVIGFGAWIFLFFIVVAVNDIDVTGDEGDITDQVPDGAALLLRFAPFLVWIAYEVFLHVSRGQTAGKMITRIRVVTAQEGTPPAWGPAAVRWGVLALPMALIPDVIGLAGSALVGFWFLWDGKRQGLHDKAASTLVVKVPAPAPRD